jgi:hypothetical protein
MNTIAVNIEPAPSTPLNLRFGVVYAPRGEDKLFAGYAVLEVEPSVFQVEGYEAHGKGAVLFRGDLGPAWHRLATCLGMTA